MLHTLMTSPFTCDLPAMLRLLSPGDDVLLLQDGVIAAMTGSQALAALLDSGAGIYVLQEDLQARGLTGQISTNATQVSYNQFVALTVKHPQQLSW